MTRAITTAELSDSQLQFYFLDQFGSGRREYLITIGLELTGAVDLDRLAAAGRSLAERHESLRFQFVDTDDGVRRITLPADEFEVGVDDLAGTPDADGELAAVVDRVCDEVVVGNGYLFRMHLVPTAPDRCVLLLVMHHLVADGWSCELMLDELSHHYRTGRPPQHTPPPYDVRLAWERGCRADGTWERDLEYWRRQLRAAPAETTFRRDRRRPAARTSDAGLVIADLAPTDLTALREAAIECGTSPTVLVLTATFLLLHRLTAEDDLVVGVATSGRLDAGLHDLVGLCVNTVAVRHEIVDGATAEETVEAARDSLLAAYEHSAVPFARVVEALGVPHTSSRTPLYQVMVAFHDGTYADCLPLDGVRVAQLTPAAPVAQCDAAFDVVQQADGTLSLEICYSLDIFSDQTVRGWVEAYRAVLADLISELTPALRRR